MIPHPPLPIRRKLKKRGRLSAQTAPRDEVGRFFALSLDLLCIAGFDGYFKRLNPAWTAHLGWPLEELEARPFIDFVHPDDRTATQAEVDKLATGEETVLFENRYLHQDGSYRWLQWNARRAVGVEQIYASARDVTRQRRLEREVLEILDREKARLGRELHDGLCQTLGGIAALSSTLSKKLAASSEAAASAAAAEISRLLNEAIGEARDLARGLDPVGLNEAGLAGMLDALSLNMQNWFGVSCRLDCDRPFLRMRREAETHLFRIAQEAVNNAITHGRAEQVKISLTITDGNGLLTIQDDGIGISKDRGDLFSLGLHSMNYRARLIGADLAVRRRTGRGTIVTCAFPLAEKINTLDDTVHGDN